MNKILIVLSLFIVTLLSGCGNVSNHDLSNHVNTMNALDTYVIEIVSSKHNLETDSIMNSFVYVDNAHNIYVVSDEEKTDIVIEDGDLIFEYINDSLFSYVFDDAWNKYRVDISYLNIKYFESVLFGFFESPEIITIGNDVMYTSHMSINDLEGSIYNIIGENFGEKYRDEDFEVNAFYDIELMRFTKFTFDL